MVFIIDIGLLLLLIFVFVGLIVGGVAELLSFLLAHMVGCIIAFFIVGLVLGIIISLLIQNKWAWISTALTTPAVLIYPLLIVIPYYLKEFKNDFLGTLLVSPLTLIILVAVFFLLWGMHVFASFGLESDYDNRTPLETILSGIIVTAIQTGIVAYFYFRWVI